MRILAECRSIPLMNLPQPTADALAHSLRLNQLIRTAMEAAGGWLPFSTYMELALYAPGLGYYSAGARKLGPEGDFVTAPEMSPLFGKVLARQVSALFESLPRILLEIGAGSGALAASLLEELQALGTPPDQYFILELSADLRQRERDTLAARVPHLLDRVIWLSELPHTFSGVVIGNEVLDAMPIEVFRITDHEVEQAGVAITEEAFGWSFRNAPDTLAGTVTPLGLAPGYRSEVSFAASAFIASLAKSMDKGVALFIDYGFPSHEYYHPQRTTGTLMCHYRHRAHANPFFLPGLQDITAHVDFSAIARAASDNGLDILGYTTQAQFLINSGITDVLADVLNPRAAGNTAAPTSAYLSLTNSAQRLLSPAEMGELFKVIALGHHVELPLLGFASGDKTHTL